MLTHVSSLMLACWTVGSPSVISIEAPQTIGQYEVAEFVIRNDEPVSANPFTEIDVTGTFGCPVWLTTATAVAAPAAMATAAVPATRMPARAGLLGARAGATGCAP